MFSHSVISQESQVLVKHVLTDSVLSLHRCEFKPRRKEEEELVSVAVKDLEAEMWEKCFSRSLMEILSEKPWKVVFSSVLNSRFSNSFQVFSILFCC